MRPSNIYNGNSYTCNMTSLHWDGSLVSIQEPVNITDDVPPYELSSGPDTHSMLKYIFHIMGISLRWDLFKGHAHTGSWYCHGGVSTTSIMYSGVPNIYSPVLISFKGNVPPWPYILTRPSIWHLRVRILLSFSEWFRLYGLGLFMI